MLVNAPTTTNQALRELSGVNGLKMNDKLTIKRLELNEIFDLSYEQVDQLAKDNPELIEEACKKYFRGCQIRNAEVFKDCLNNRTYKEIARKHKLNISRIGDLNSLVREKFRFYVNYLIKKRDTPVVMKREDDIKELNLSTRTYKCLIKEDIRTIEELSLTTRGTLKNIKNLGKKGITEIEEALSKRNLSLNNLINRL